MADKQHCAAVDYLTVTTTDDRRGYALLELYRNVLHNTPGTAVDHGKEWKSMSYVGFISGGMVWAHSDRYGYLMRLPGERAEDNWHRLKPAKINITRIDLCVTVQLDKPDKTLIRKYLDIARETSYRGKPLYATYTVNTGDRGATIAINKRTGQQYGRIYDWGAKNGRTPYQTIRYEVELKKPTALPMFSTLLDSWVDDPLGTKEKMASYVWQWYDARGIRPVYTPGKQDLIIERVERVRSAERTLAWIRTSVRPTVQQMIQAGLGREIITALGLTEFGFDTYDQGEEPIEGNDE